MMKLGTQTGNLVNHVMSMQTIDADRVFVGDGATICRWSDRTACTVVEIDRNSGIIAVQEDTAKRVDNNGMSDLQEYEYERNKKGAVHYFKRYKTGWEHVVMNNESRRWNKAKGMDLVVGARRQYYDYSF